jgi:tetratricopeptide (TPR) repeat protein
MEFVAGPNLAEWLRYQREAGTSAGARSSRSSSTRPAACGRSTSRASSTATSSRRTPSSIPGARPRPRLRPRDHRPPPRRARPPPADHLRRPGLTSTGELVGTTRYASPEQFVGTDLDHRSDQFSFCVALFEALWGHPPFGDGCHRPASSSTAATAPPSSRARPGDVPGLADVRGPPRPRVPPRAPLPRHGRAAPRADPRPPPTLPRRRPVLASVLSAASPASVLARAPDPLDDLSLGTGRDRRAPAPATGRPPHRRVAWPTPTRDRLPRHPPRQRAGHPAGPPPGCASRPAAARPSRPCSARAPRPSASGWSTSCPRPRIASTRASAASRAARPGVTRDARRPRRRPARRGRGRAHARRLRRRRRRSPRRRDRRRGRHHLPAVARAQFALGHLERLRDRRDAAQAALLLATTAASRSEDLALAVDAWHELAALAVLGEHAVDNADRLPAARRQPAARGPPGRRAIHGLGRGPGAGPSTPTSAASSPTRTASSPTRSPPHGEAIVALAALLTGVTDVRGELAASLLDRGRAHSDTGDHAAALADYREALQLELGPLRRRSSLARRQPPRARAGAPRARRLPRRRARGPARPRDRHGPRRRDRHGPRPPIARQDLARRRSAGARGPAHRRGPGGDRRNPAPRRCCAPTPTTSRRTSPRAATTPPPRPCGPAPPRLRARARGPRRVSAGQRPDVQRGHLALLADRPAEAAEAADQADVVLRRAGDLGCHAGAGASWLRGRILLVREDHAGALRHLEDAAARTPASEAIRADILDDLAHTLHASIALQCTSERSSPRPSDTMKVATCTPRPSRWLASSYLHQRTRGNPPWPPCSSYSTPSSPTRSSTCPRSR